MTKSGQHFVFLLFCSLSIVMAFDMDGASNKARYDNYRLVIVKLETNNHVKLFQELEEQSDSYTFYGHALKAPQDLVILVAAHK